ncbi:MAG: ArsR/SmtB family transcription factor [Nitrospiria bacterium]
MTNYDNPLNSVFKALTDPTRRAVLMRLSRGPLSMKELAKPFNMALPSFSQHLDVLEGCGLVKSSKTGRIRTYALKTKQLKTAEHWLSKYRKQWEQRLDSLDNYLKTMKEE